MKNIIVLLMAAEFWAVSLAGCTTIKDWTAKTTKWEIGVAQNVLGKGDDNKNEEPEEDDEEDEEESESDDEDGGIIGWTKRTTEWEMREADKVVSGKKSTPPARSSSDGNVCRVKDGCSVANVRSGPSTNNAVIGKLRGGDPVRVIEERSGWVRIRLDNGTNGWVYGALVEYSAH